MLNDGGVVFSKGFADGLRPDPILTVSEWAEKYRLLSSKASAEPGRWRNARTPYLVEIMDSLSPSDPCQDIVFMAGAQLGKTEAINNWLGYIVDYSPAPTMAIMPTLSMVKRNSKTRLDPLFSETPRLAEKIAPARSRDSGNTMFQKDFPGGTLILAGANSTSELASSPIKNLALDEIDRYPGNVGDEGDAVDLATARTKTFRRRKRILTSTPTLEGSSRIASAYEDSDQRLFMVPCPHCDHRQHFVWKNLRWEKGKPETVMYFCEDCGAGIEEFEKTRMLARGQWVPQNPGHKTKGYHLSSLYSPVGFFSWEDAARQWETIHKASGSLKTEKLKTFTNTVLGEVWVEKGEAPDWERIYENNRKPYTKGKVPAPALMLTAGVDVQADRLECEVVGWGRNRMSWSVDYIVLPGDTTQPEVWTRLSEVLHKTWDHELGGSLKIRLMAVDSGYNTQHVYNFVRTQTSDHCIAVKGRDELQMTVGQPSAVDVKITGKRISRGAKVWPVGSSVVKREIYACLKIRPPKEEGEAMPDGICFFPEYGTEYFKQLTAEQVVTRRVRGYSRHMWEKIYERNEALDCRVYARAAANVAGYDRLEEKHFELLENSVKLEKVVQKVAPKKQPIKFKL